LDRFQDVEFPFGFKYDSAMREFRLGRLLDCGTLCPAGVLENNVARLEGFILGWAGLFEKPSCLARENGNDSKEQEASLHIESVAPVPKRF